MIQHILYRSLFSLSGLLIIGMIAASCGDPLSVDTPRRIIPVNVDSILLSEPFLSKSSDTLYATVDGEQVSFASELLRPVFYNSNVGEAWYISVQGVDYKLTGEEYQALALRMDNIQGPGTYPIEDPYNLPKRVDPSASSEYGGKYILKKNGVKENFVTTASRPEGAIKILTIDTVRGVVVGRFFFTAYDEASGKQITIEDGVFRLHLSKR